MLHHPWWAYEKIFDKMETKHFGQSGLVLGNLPSKKSDWWVCVLAAQQCLEDHMFFLGLQMSPHLPEAPHQPTRDLSWAVMSCFCPRNREKRFCFLAHAFRVCVKSWRFRNCHVFQEIVGCEAPNKNPISFEMHLLWPRCHFDGGEFLGDLQRIPCPGRCMYRIRDPGLKSIDQELWVHNTALLEGKIGFLRNVFVKPVFLVGGGG